ncbi:MAG TPA: tRNA pseudouridine(38-40) synthase TruA [Thermoanaerobaculia bacterium]|nr:tRNA pseudouridine(38-40) synthase TruA [Thermoanaerobaculia bacterium]
MPNYKLIVEYDGTRYRGWQTQKNTDRTVAAVLDRAASDLFGEPVRMTGAGRTDAGVHALGQVANFRAAKRLAGAEIRYGINDRLPADVNVLSAEEVDAAFHARHDALSREYEYRISRVRTAFEKPFVWWVRDALDADAMGRAARQFTGDHDFASFCENPEGQTSTRVRVERCEIAELGAKILLRVEASHFLWKMIRRMTGTLVEIGRGTLPVEAVKTLLASRSAQPARWTAPPSGLFLARVVYGEGPRTRPAPTRPIRREASARPPRRGRRP